MHSLHSLHCTILYYEAVLEDDTLLVAVLACWHADMECIRVYTAPYSYPPSASPGKLTRDGWWLAAGGWRLAVLLGGDVPVQQQLVEDP